MTTIGELRPEDFHKPEDIDRRAHSKDKAAADDLDGLLELLDRLVANDGLRARQRTMREYQDEGLRGTPYDERATDTAGWCDTHAQELRVCNGPMGLYGTCTGSPYPHQDKMAERAIAFRSDRAAQDAARVHALVKQLAAIGEDLVGIVQNYPVHAHQLPGVAVVAPEGWCKAHFRAGIHKTAQKDGNDHYYYAGPLCRDCGRFKSENHQEPHPEWLKALDNPVPLTGEAKDKLFRKYHPGVKTS